MAWQGYDEESEGFNADDYMSDLEELMSEGGGTTMGGLWEALKSDYGKTQDQWKESMGRYDDYYKERAGHTERTQERWDTYMGGLEETYGKHREAVEDWSGMMEDRAGQAEQRGEQYADRVRGIVGEGSEMARTMQKASTAKFEELEQEMKDYSTASISGLVRGTTARERSRSMQAQDEARRSGAPQSVIDQIGYESEREISESLQGAIASSAQQWQESLQVAGRMTAGAYGQEAGLETNLMGVELASEDAIFQCQMQSSNTATDLLMNAQGQRVSMEKMIADQMNTAKQEEMVAVANAEIFEMEGMKEYAQLMADNPAVKAASVLSTLLGYQSMPGYDRLSKIRAPGSEQKRNANENRKALKGYREPQGGWGFDMSSVDPQRLEQAIRSWRVRGNYDISGRKSSLNEWLSRKFG